MGQQALRRLIPINEYETINEENCFKSKCKQVLNYINKVSILYSITLFPLYLSIRKL